MKYFVLGTVVLAATFMIGCDSSGGVCCKGGKVRGVIKDKDKIKMVRTGTDMNVSYSQPLKTYDWNVTTTGYFPTEANCTFISHAPTIVIPKTCFDYESSNSVNIDLKGTNEDNETITESEPEVEWTTSPSGGMGGDS